LEGLTVRRICLLFLVLLVAVLAAVPAQAAEPPEESDATEGTALTPETLGKLTLTIDAGGHQAAIHWTAFTPDGKQIITVGGDNTVRLWDAATGEPRRVLRPPGMNMNHAALSADGRLLAVAALYLDKGKKVPIISVLNLADGRLEQCLPRQGQAGHTEPIKALAFSPDGKTLASGSGDKTVRVWDLAGGKSRVVHRATKETKELPQALAFSPDGRRLAHIDHTHAGFIIDLKTDKESQLEVEARKGKEPTKEKDRHSLAALAWSEDGEELAAYSHSDGVHFWHHDGKPHRQHKPLLLQDLALHNVLFSRDFKYLLASWQDAAHKPHVARFDLETGDRSSELGLGAGGWVWSLALSPDGKRAVTSTIDVNEAVVWQTADGKELKRLTPHQWLDPKTAVGWSADGKSVLLGPTRRFDLAELRLRSDPVRAGFQAPVHALPALGLSLDIDPAKPQDVRVTKDKKPFAVLSLPKGQQQAVTSGTLLGAGRAVLTDNRHNALFLFDLDPGSATEGRKPVRKLAGHATPPWSVIPAPEPPPSSKNRYLLSIAGDQTLRIWDPKQERALLALYVQGEDWIMWTPQGGYYAATPGGEKLVGWTLDDGPDRLTAFYPAERFRKLFYQPELIRHVLEKGDVEEARQAAIQKLEAKGDAAAEEVQKAKKTRDVKIEDVLPPRVEIKEVKEVKDGVQITARATPVSASEPVESLRLLLDGRTHPDAKPVTIDKGAAAEATWTIAPVPGLHEVKVLARCPDVSGLSAVYPLDAPLPDKDKPRLYRICVGVNDYDQKGLELKAARQDAEAVFEELEKSCTGKGNRFREAAGPKPLVDKDATRAAVLKALEDVRLGKEARPGDLVVVFFGGHGVVHGGEFYLLTREANTEDLKNTALSGKDLKAAFQEMPCSVLLIIDACHSTAVLGAFKPATDDLTRSMSDDQVAVTVLAAAMGYETAGELGGKHGLFTQALLDGLKAGAGVPCDPDDHQMYVHHLYGYVFGKVRTASKGAQNPFLNLPWTVPPLALREVPAR
jgi:WD40 repeat protein